MSLLSHLLHPIPILCFGLTAISAAVEPKPAPVPVPPAPVAPAPPPAPASSKEQLALEPVSSLVQNCALVFQLEAELLKRSTLEHGQEPPSADLVKFRKEHASKLGDAWSEIAKVRASVSAMSLDPETEVLATPAHQMHAATKVLSELNQKMIKILESGKPPDSPEVKAIVEKSKFVAAVREGEAEKANKEIMRVRGDVQGAKEAAAKAGPATAPTAEKQGQIVPGKKEPELPPGMTRGK